MTSSEWAAWVQAFGSIGAILAAAAIAGWQSKGEARLRKATEQIVARDLAMLIEQPMRAWSTDAKEWIRVLGRIDGMGGWAMISQLADSPELMEPPDEVLRFVGRFRDFGSAARSLQAATVAWNALADAKSQVRHIWDHGADDADPQTEGMQWVVRMIRTYATAAIAAGEEVEALKNS